jgi:uncharacterized protein YegL
MFQGQWQHKPIDELNEGVKVLFEEIKEDNVASQRLEIGIVTFDSNVKVVREPENIWSNTNVPHLTAGSSTAMVDGLREGIKIVRAAKDYYKSTNQGFYRPWVILITDGAPDTDQDINGISNEIKAGVNAKDFWFFAVGVEGADMNLLQQISAPQMPPLKLQGLKFSAFFKWLSRSMGEISKSAKDANIDLNQGMSKWLILLLINKFINTIQENFYFLIYPLCSMLNFY